MILIQAAIGTVNDIVDAPLDAGRKLGKPIPAGIVDLRAARAIAILAAVGGLAASSAARLETLPVAVAILAVGLLYDLRLRGTVLSWLPFAAGIPLLPVYAWAGATGTVPQYFAVLLPAAFLAGAALAIANALADVERDAAAGATSVAVRLGSRRAWAAHTVLHAAVVVIAFLSFAATEGPPLAAAGIAAAATVVAAGAALGRSRRADRRERAWELEAVGVAALASAWLGGIAGAVR